jgi:hypothetical protein
MQVQVPQGLKAGDTFVVNDTIVVVPADIEDGAYIEIVPRESISPHSPEGPCSSTAVGAAVAGAIVGTVLLGPIGGVALAGGAAYAT